MTLPFHLLNESEKECLRLVHEGHSSKSIAIRRGVRSDRIDKVLIAARNKLGGLPRRDAARLFVRHERALQQDLSPAAPGAAPA